MGAREATEHLVQSTLIDLVLLIIHVYKISVQAVNKTITVKSSTRDNVKYWKSEKPHRTEKSVQCGAATIITETSIKLLPLGYMSRRTSRTICCAPSRHLPPPSQVAFASLTTYLTKMAHSGLFILRDGSDRRKRTYRLALWPREIGILVKMKKI